MNILYRLTYADLLNKLKFKCKKNLCVCTQRQHKRMKKERIGIVDICLREVERTSDGLEKSRRKEMMKE